MRSSVVMAWKSATSSATAHFLNRSRYVGVEIVESKSKNTARNAALPEGLRGDISPTGARVRRRGKTVGGRLVRRLGCS